MKKEETKIKETIKKAGIKNTNKRIAILDIIKNSKEKQLSVYDIEKEYNDTHEEKIILSTIYRNLKKLEETNIITKKYNEEGISLYSLLKKCEGHKHIAECVNCHKKIELDRNPYEEIEKELLESKGFVLEHEMKLKGSCNECSS